MTLESTIIEVRQDAVAEIAYPESGWRPGDEWKDCRGERYKFQRWLPVPERVECQFTSTQ